MNHSQPGDRRRMWIVAPECLSRHGEYLGWYLLQQKSLGVLSPTFQQRLPQLPGALEGPGGRRAEQRPDDLPVRNPLTQLCQGDHRGGVVSIG